jgi:hypothetical protein
VNDASTTPITLEGKAFEKMESFAYLGSIVEKQGGTDTNERSESVIKRQLSCSLKRYGHLGTCQPTPRSGYKVSTTVRGRDLDHHGEHDKENPDIHQHLSENDTPNTLA